MWEGWAPYLSSSYPTLPSPPSAPPTGPQESPQSPRGPAGLPQPGARSADPDLLHGMVSEDSGFLAGPLTPLVHSTWLLVVTQFSDEDMSDCRKEDRRLQVWEVLTSHSL